MNTYDIEVKFFLNIKAEDEEQAIKEAEELTKERAAMLIEENLHDVTITRVNDKEIEYR